MPLYHVAPLALREGSVIEPGNFGRILQRYQYGTADNGWMIARELAFEMTRMRMAPQAPSRWQACFALGGDINAARRYQATSSRLGVLHMVELVDSGAPQHWGYLSHFDGMEGCDFIPIVNARAEEYWRGEGAGDRELVTVSGLRVIRRVL